MVIGNVGDWGGEFEAIFQCCIIFLTSVGSFTSGACPTAEMQTNHVSLLLVDQEYIVRSVAYAFRNLAVDSVNKWSIGE